MSKDFSDETLMAFADGELDEAEATAVEAAIDADPALAERVALFMETRAMVGAALKPLADEPVPPALEAAVRRSIEAARSGDLGTAAASTAAEEATTATVVAFRPRPTQNLSFARFALPLAASLAVIVAGAAGYFAGRGGSEGTSGLQVAGLDRPALTSVLESVGSGEQISLGQGGQRFRAIATFRDDAGTLCREFEVDAADGNTVVSVACRPDAGWTVNFAVVAPGVQGGYAPASSTESLDAYLGAIGAGDPISAEEEREALDALR